jgi:hypothetical protein
LRSYFSLFSILVLKQIFAEKNPIRCNSLSKFIIPYFKLSSTRFGRHTAQHQEPKTAQAASGFA